MSDLYLALLSFAGYEVIALITARQVYRHAMFTRYDYRGKERHAGKAWGVSQLWGPALILAPPAGACTLAGFIIYGTCLGLRNGMRWFIKAESLNARNFVPHKVTTEALEAECGRAGKDLPSRARAWTRRTTSSGHSAGRLSNKGMHGCMTRGSAMTEFTIEDAKRVQRELKLGDFHVIHWHPDTWVMAHADAERASEMDLTDCCIHKWMLTEDARHCDQCFPEPGWYMIMDEHDVKGLAL